MNAQDSGAGPTDKFFTTLTSGEVRLLGGYSATSGRHHFPLADCCPYSGADDVVPGALPATGQLTYWTVVTVPPPGYLGPVPYGFGVVELDAVGLLLVSRLTTAAYDSLQPGTQVALTVEHMPTGGGTLAIWAFQPVGDGGRPL